MLKETSQPLAYGGVGLYETIGVIGDSLIAYYAVFDREGVARHW
jgi:hypothetical protein